MAEMYRDILFVNVEWVGRLGLCTMVCSHYVQVGLVLQYGGRQVRGSAVLIPGLTRDLHILQIGNHLISPRCIRAIVADVEQQRRHVHGIPKEMRESKTIYPPLTCYAGSARMMTKCILQFLRGPPTKAHWVSGSVFLISWRKRADPHSTPVDLPGPRACFRE